MAHTITVAEVREELKDRAAEDHLVLIDLAFTDEDIEWAMKACARKFNSIRPLGITVCWDGLPSNTSVFFDGITWALIRRWHMNVGMNDYDYSAGGVTANVQGSRRKNLEALRDKLEQQFLESATDLKVTANLADAWGGVG